MLCLTYGENKIWQSIKKTQNIMSMIVDWVKDATMFLIIEESKKTISDSIQGTVRAL